MRKRLRLMPILMSIMMVFAMMPMMTGTAYAEGESQLGKICFDGDSDYEWAHFYGVDDDEASLYLDDLDITVLDGDGNEINSEEYDLAIKSIDYDEEKDEDVLQEEEEPFGIIGGREEGGFTEYRATATAKGGGDYTGSAEGTFFIIDKHSLNFFCADIQIDGADQEGWRMHDRFWLDPGAEINLHVKNSCEQVELDEGTDYNVTYYRRSGDVDDDNQDFNDILVSNDETRLDAAPTEQGEYFAVIEGEGAYYGENTILIDILGMPRIKLRSEARELWSDENLTFDVIVPAGVPENLRFIVGTRGEDDWDVVFADRDNESDYFEYDAENKKLTLHGKAIFDEIGESYLNIYVNAKDQGEVVAEGFADANVREAKCEYDLPEDDNILPGWDGWIDENIPVWRCNSEFPDGKDDELKITDVTIKSQNPDNEVLELNQEGDGWKYLANKFGSATIEVKYTDFDDTEKTHEFTVYVSDTVYNVDMWSETGVYQGLPGTSIELQANARKETAEKRDNGREGDERDEWWHHEGTSEGLQYQWTITGGTEFATINQDSNDPTKATLKFKDMPAGWDHMGEEVDVKVSVTDAKSDDPETVCTERWQDFYVNDQYHQIYPAIINSGLDIGKSLTIEPELRFYKLGKDGYDVVKNVNFEIKDYDGNAIDVDDLTITRKGEWDTNFRLEATWGEDGWKDQWYHLDGKNYEICFEYDDFEIYDDQTLTVKLNKEDLEGLTEELADPNNKDYEIRYTVGRWNNEQENWDVELSSDTYEADKDGITISGKTIKDANLDGVNIRAELFINGEKFGGENISRDTWCWLGLHDSCTSRGEEHKWTEWSTIFAPTFTTKGLKIRVCSDHPRVGGCGEVQVEEIPEIIDISKATVTISNVTYNKKAQTPAPTVKYDGATLQAGTDYTVAYKNNTNAGKGTVTITGKGKYGGTKTATFTIAKAANPIKLSAKKATVKFTAVKKKNQTVKQAKACAVSGAVGKVTWKKASGNAKITVAANGNITVKKGLKKGTYKVKVNATAAGNANYNKATKAATVTIVVK